ncbi:hypothetical protein [Thomasclavelia cocleata]|uniref:hypothetical protein n=1 Tax=Thomasclavelia cocleata TaxID=69824 RepID=UPI00242CAAA1|nr:hypothetical protein [Thomasclavelia cocleata]
MLLKSSRLIGSLTQFNMNNKDQIESKTIKIELSINKQDVSKDETLIQYQAEVIEPKNRNSIMKKELVYEVKFSEYADIDQVIDEHKDLIIEYLAESIQLDLQQMRIMEYEKDKEISENEKELDDIEKRYN